MRKFIFTSSEYQGEFSLTFNFQGRLKVFDLCDIELTDMQMRWLMNYIPFDISELQEFVNQIKKFQATEETLSVALEDFKRVYPYQRNMHLLPEIWNKLSLSDRFLAVEQGEEYRKYCIRNSGWYKPKIAAAWLKAKEYLNDWRKM